MMDRRSSDNTAENVHPLKLLTPAQFAALGGSAVAYVKPVSGLVLSTMISDAEFNETEEYQLVMSADGTPLMVADTTRQDCRAKETRKPRGMAAGLFHVSGAIAGSGGVIAFERLGENGVKPFCFRLVAQLIDDVLGAQHARNAGKGLEMVCTGADRRQQHHHQIDCLIVDSVEIDRVVQSGKHGNDTLEASELAMRDSNTIAQTSRAKFLAANDGRKDVCPIKTGQFCRLVSKQFEELAL
jgi:hypothetical protein